MPGYRDKVIQSLARVVGPTHAVTGCISCRLYQELENDDGLLVVMEWRDEQSLVDYLQGEEVRIILSALEYSRDQPQVLFDTVTDSKGIEFIADCRMDPDFARE